MATVLEQQDDQETQEQDSQVGQQLSQNVGDPQAGGGGGAPTAAPGGQRKGSGRYTNLRKYLDANQGAGERLTSGITGTAARNIAGIEQKGSEQADQIRQNIQGEKDRLAESSGFLGQLGQQGGAQQIVGDQDQFNRFSQLRSGENQSGQIGQQSQDAFNLYNQGVGQAQDVAQQAGTEQGRFNLLRGSFGNPQYNLGQRRLDQLFLQSGGQNTLGNLQQNLQGQATQAQSNLQNLQGELGQGAQEIQSQAQTASDQLSNFLRGGAGEGVESELHQRGFDDIQQSLQDTQAARQAQISGDRAALVQAGQTGQWSPEQMQAAGLIGGQSLFGLSSELGNYLGPERQVGLSQVATQQDADRYNALRQLMGETQGGLNFDPSQFGQELGDNSVNLSPSFQEELGRRGTAFSKEFAPGAQDIATLRKFATQGGSFGDVGSDEFLRNYGAFSRAGLLPEYNPNAQFLQTGMGQLIKQPDGSMGYRNASGILSAADAREQQLRQFADTSGAFDVVGGGNEDDLFQQLMSRYSQPGTF